MAKAILDTDTKLEDDTNWQLEVVQTLHKIKDILKDIRDKP